MILNKSHWNWGDSVNDDLLFTDSDMNVLPCFRHICTLYSSSAVSAVFVCFFRAVNQNQPNNFIQNDPNCLNNELGYQGVLSLMQVTLYVAFFSLFFFFYRSGICVFNPVMIMECEIFAMLHRIFFFMRVLGIWPSPLYVLHPFSFLYIVNVLAFFFKNAFLFHVGFLYLWHESLCLCNHCFFFHLL